MGFRRVAKFGWIAFLWSLSLTLLPILNGLLAGVLFCFWDRREVNNNMQHFTDELGEVSAQEYWTVPGAQSFSDYMDNTRAFHSTRLSTPRWTMQLDYQLPIEYYGDGGIDRWADLDHLMADVKSCNPAVPKESWVYITDLASPWFPYDDWNEAFDDLIQKSYVSHSLDATSFHFVECSHSAFLCGIWNVKPPALLHLSVEDSAPASDELDPDLTYAVDRKRLRPVTARIIELPVQDAFLGRPWHVFPSPKEQLQALISTPGLYEQFDPYDREEQIMKRFNEYMDSFWDWKGSVFYLMRRTESWCQDYITEPLGIESYLVDLQSLTFTVTFLLAQLILLPVQSAWQAVKDFFGYPGAGDWTFGGSDDPPTNFMEDMFGGFMQSMAGKDRFSQPTADS
ncbi:Uu.00g119660.m01.CDS01 [Anthostomella pinea]|uniref:Uu.00g119660.m01.CDS01 n=1 Tax=Anthostomella pinea TaxID=933095 RepID=A0AAI8VGQ1_9PEZI|nr:Uu.00g119660.m01.CDS01 [Anthostomella pinea]